MLQAHSFLWHYLWLAPHILQMGLAIWMWRAGLGKVFPVFLAYAVFEALEEFTLYTLDVLPSVTATTFWIAFSVGLVIEGLLKFAIAGELFRRLLRPWPTVAKTGNILITCAGVMLALVAALTAGLTTPANPHWIVAGPHVLQQSMYVIETGLILFIVVFAAYFRLAWERKTYGIALGIGIVSCEQLAGWAITSSGALGDRSYLLDFLGMATYHLCVLIWAYYLLVPAKVAKELRPAPLPENNLKIWNEELEHLLQR